MKQDATLMTISHILKEDIDLINFNEDLILINSNNPNLPFRHPFKFNGIIIGFAIDGSFPGYVNLQNIILSPKQLIICTPGDILQLGSITSGRAIIIAISLDFISELNIRVRLNELMTNFLKCGKGPIFDLTDENMNDLIEISKLLEKNILSSGIYKKDILVNITSTYVYTIGQLLNEYLNSIKEENNITTKRSSTIFIQFMDLLNQYHQTERSIGFYADKLCLTTKYFAALIKNISGINATDYINKFVILEAKSLLKYSDKSIQEISNTLNFPNQSFFGKYFKRHTGMTPGEYKAL